MSNHSSRSTKKIDEDIVDIYKSSSANVADIMTVGYRNSTADYIISGGSDLTNPYLTVQNDGTILITNDLVVKGNNIISIETGSFPGKLESLFLQENELKAIDAEMFFGLSNIEFLYLFENKIEAVDCDTFKDLKNNVNIYLGKNPLIDSSQNAQDACTSNKKINFIF